MKAGVLRSDFLLNHLDWLRGCANLCLEEIRPVEVLLLQMWRKKLLFYSLCWTPRKGLYGSSRRLKPISLAKDLHQVLKPKKIGTSEVTDIAKLRVKHHPFRHCLWRFFTSNDDLQCALYILYKTLYSGRFQRKFCESRLKVGTIPYRTDITCVQERNVPDHGSATGTGVHSKAVWDWECIMHCDYIYKNLQESSLVWENNPEWHFSIRSILSVPALGAFLVVCLSICLSVTSSVVHHEGTGGGMKV